MPARSRSPARRKTTARSPRLRRAGPGDLDLLVQHRRKMWEEIGGRPESELDRADPIYRRWARRELEAHHLIAFVVEGPDGRPAGSGAVWLVPTQPRPGPLGRPRMPYLMSMYTDPAYRGHGVASRIVRATVRWARREGYARVFLHASAMGRSVYARLGFVPGNEMRLDLAPPRRPGRPRPVARRR
jgi:GNAT superfamily N-acetyltransferase